MRAIVAGAAGFLGSHFCKRLLDEGIHVLGIDNFVTGSPSNLRALEGAKHFEFRNHDVVEPLNLNSDFDYVVNFASPASPLDFPRMPLEIMRTNSVGCDNLLRLATERKARYFFASTSEIYGEPQVHPQTEHYWGNVDTNGPRSVYDESKRYGETLTFAYQRLFGVDTRIVRIFNVYGPGMRLFDGRVVTTLIRQALLNQPLTINGDGSQTRSFMYVDDAIEGFYDVLMGDVTTPVNIGNPKETSILELAEMIQDMTGSSSPIVNSSLPHNDPTRRCPDITLAKQALNWEPSIDLQIGLERCIKAIDGELRSEIALGLSEPAQASA